MRWRILKALLTKEALRHVKNRGGLILAALLVTASLVLATLNPAGEKSDKSASLVGGIHHCIVWYDADTDWVRYLQANVPVELKSNILFYRISQPLQTEDRLKYPIGTGGIELRSLPQRSPRYRVWVRYPEGDRAGMSIYEMWFWRESYHFFRTQASKSLPVGIDPDKALPSPNLDDGLWPEREAFQELTNRAASYLGSEVESLAPALELKETMVPRGALDLRAAIATSLIMFSLCFSCIYLMPSLTCEERERGLLLAQALSPATSFEILAAKFLFYPVFGMLLATILASIHNAAVLSRPIFWLALVIFAVGTLGIGMTIACLAKTQRAASLAALCYMLAIALILLICQQSNITTIPSLFLEYHSPHILHAIVTDRALPEIWINLAAAAVLAVGWATLAVILFRRRGWQ
jgi:hypothetical protein